MFLIGNTIIKSNIGFTQFENRLCLEFIEKCSTVTFDMSLCDYCTNMHLSGFLKLAVCKSTNLSIFGEIMKRFTTFIDNSFGSLNH